MPISSRRSATGRSSAESIPSRQPSRSRRAVCSSRLTAERTAPAGRSTAIRTVRGGLGSAMRRVSRSIQAVIRSGGGTPTTEARSRDHSARRFRRASRARRVALGLDALPAGRLGGHLGLRPGARTRILISPNRPEDTNWPSTTVPSFKVMTSAAVGVGGSSAVTTGWPGIPSASTATCQDAHPSPLRRPGRRTPLPIESSSLRRTLASRSAPSEMPDPGSQPVPRRFKEDDRTVRRGARVQDAGAVAESPFLGPMEVAAEMHARPYLLKRPKKTPLTTVPTRLRQVGQADRAFVRQEQIDPPLVDDRRRDRGDVVVGHVVRLDVRLARMPPIAATRTPSISGSHLGPSGSATRRRSGSVPGVPGSRGCRRW